MTANLQSPCKIQLQMISPKSRWVVHLGGCHQGGKPLGTLCNVYFVRGSSFYHPICLSVSANISWECIFKRESVQKLHIRSSPHACYVSLSRIKLKKFLTVSQKQSHVSKDVWKLFVILNLGPWFPLGCGMKLREQYCCWGFNNNSSTVISLTE